MEVVKALIAAVLGVAVGGVLNMLADDLPDDDKVTSPHYPDGAPRPWLGLLAFLGGKRASPGGAKLSWRHPVVEVVTALCFTALAVSYPLDLQLIFYFFYACVFVLVTVIDMEHRLILFVVMVPSGLIALVDALLVPDPGPSLVDAFVGGLLGFGMFWLVWYMGIWFNRLRAREGEDPAEMEVAFGFGDVTLATVCGFIIGWQAMIFAIFIAVFAGGFVSLLWVLSHFISKDNYAMFTALPYGPYIVFGTVMMLFFRDEVRHFMFTQWFDKFF
jgi:leader peptidase (prepilin peptidase)/N-methyltransferase